MQVPFYTADVFTSVVFGGAQIAVIPDASVLSELQMQQIATELNLWSTVFVTTDSSAANCFSLRIFSPQKEIDFGSHIAIATAHVLSRINKITKHTPDTALTFSHGNHSFGMHISMQNDGNELAILSLSTTPEVDNYVPSNEELGELLSLDPKMIGSKNFRTLLVANKGIYIVVPIHYLDQLNAVVFNQKAWNMALAPNTFAQQLLLFSPQTEAPGADFHLRLVGPNIDPLAEPPVGSTMPAFAAYLAAHEHVKKGTYSFLAERGSADKRQSVLHVEVDNKSSDTLTLRVGGHAVLVCEGKLNI